MSSYGGRSTESTTTDNAALKLEITCYMCSRKLTTELVTDEGWTFRYNVRDLDAFCPDHAPIEGFLREQCPGCVAGWPDCGLMESFAYNGPRRTITDEDHDTLDRGICPRRVNGSFVLDGNPRTLRQIDLSSPAVVGGRAMSDAIRAYIEEYGND